MSLFSSNLIILFPVGCCLYIAMRLADTRADLSSGGVARALMYTLVSVMISISLLGLILRIGRFQLLWLIALPVIGLIIFAKSAVLGRAAMLLSFVQFKSYGQTSQYIRMAGDFARMNSGRIRRRARLLQSLLAKGNGLATALEASRVARNDHEVLCCRTVEKYGPDSINELPGILQPLRVHTEAERLVSRLTVIPWLLQGILIVLLMVEVVIPTLEEMRREFNIPLQSGSLSLASFEQLREFPFNMLVLGMILFGLAFSFFVMVFITFPHLIHFFPLRYLFSGYHRSVSLISLAIAAKHEANLMDACQVASKLARSPYFSRRLELIADRLNQGKSPQSALVELFVLSNNEAAFVSNAITTHSLSWALQHIAIGQVEQMLRRISAFTQLSLIFCVLFFAAFYGAFAYAMFQLLSQMILQFP